MIEILQIFFQIIFIFIITYFCIPNLRFYPSKISFSSLDILSINSIILLNIFLIFSFTGLNNLFLLLIFIIFTIFNLINIKKLQIDFKILYIFLLIFLISVSIANSLEFGWDAKFFWFLKTINFYENQNILNLDKLPASDYPHLGSFIWSFFWKFPFSNFEYHGRIFFIFFYILSIFSFFEIFKLNTINKILFSTCILLISFDFEIFNGNQEILIFSLSLYSAKLSYLILNNKNNSNYIYYLLLVFNASIWIKNEALFLIGFVLFLILLFAKLDNYKKIIIILISIFLVLIRISILKYLNTNLESFEFEKTLKIDRFSNIFDSLKLISYYILVYLTQLPLILIGIFLYIYNSIVYKVDKLQIYLLSYALLNILFIFMAFIFSMENIEWQVRVGLKRVMFETSGFYLFSLAYLINRNIKK